MIQMSIDEISDESNGQNSRQYSRGHHGSSEGEHAVCDKRCRLLVTIRSGPFNGVIIIREYSAIGLRSRETENAPQHSGRSKKWPEGRL